MLSRVLRKSVQPNPVLFQNSLRSFAAGNSLWKSIESAPPDPILGLNDAFKKDTSPKKVLLGMGAYRDNDGKPLILGCVK
jgi:aspartate aminotransferase